MIQIKRRMVKGRTYTIQPTHIVQTVTGMTMSFYRETRADEVLLDGLRGMWFGGVQVENNPPRVSSRWV
jgi:hypothetical protein